MNYSPDYERWFRETGQFLEPAGDFKTAGELRKLELLKAWGQSVWDYHQEQLSDEQGKTHDAEEEAANAKEELKDKCEQIREVIFCSDGEDEKALKQIEKLVA